MRDESPFSEITDKNDSCAFMKTVIGSFEEGASLLIEIPFQIVTPKLEWGKCFSMIVSEPFLGILSHHKF